MRDRGDLTNEQWEQIEPLLPKAKMKRERPAQEHRQLLNGILWVRGVDSTLSFLLTDHLGSTSLTTDASGNLISELRYTAWGETRYVSGTTPTNYTFTG